MKEDGEKRGSNPLPPQVDVTVLVAVYNAQRYLRECLDSLLQQSLQHFQAICVDDGSTDGSWDILQEYASKDRRIETIRLKENQGQAHARNVGLRAARGTFTCFLDSDDRLSPDALRSAVDVFHAHERVDCVLFHVVNCDEQGNKVSDYPMPTFEKLSGNEAFELSLTWKIHGIYMVRTSIHRQYPYDETCKTYSDDNTTRIHYVKSREVRCCEGIYEYRHHAASVTHRIDATRFNYLKANESMRRQLMDLHVPNHVLTLYENVRWLILIDSYMFYYNHRKQLSAPERAYGLTEIKRVWRDIDTSCLDIRHKMKFGYMPFRWSWTLFRLQEEAYFSLRKLYDLFRFAQGRKAFCPSPQGLSAIAARS
ncbi:MAG: glycosyltransferase family 2 protein [Prevotella sp.]|nr:glycosyltransferase family 2 protein [Prevotella sp.]